MDKAKMVQELDVNGWWKDIGQKQHIEKVIHVVEEDLLVIWTSHDLFRFKIHFTPENLSLEFQDSAPREKQYQLIIP